MGKKIIGFKKPIYAQLHEWEKHSYATTATKASKGRKSHLFKPPWQLSPATFTETSVHAQALLSSSKPTLLGSAILKGRTKKLTKKQIRGCNGITQQGLVSAETCGHDCTRTATRKTCSRAISPRIRGRGKEQRCKPFSVCCMAFLKYLLKENKP